MSKHSSPFLFGLVAGTLIGGCAVAVALYVVDRRNPHGLPDEDVLREAAVRVITLRFPELPPTKVDAALRATLASNPDNRLGYLERPVVTFLANENRRAYFQLEERRERHVVIYVSMGAIDTHFVPTTYEVVMRQDKQGNWDGNISVYLIRD